MRHHQVPQIYRKKININIPFKTIYLDLSIKKKNSFKPATVKYKSYVKNFSFRLVKL